MGERLTKVEEIIKKYETKQKELENKYDNKDLKDKIAEIDKKLRPSELHIQRLEEELKAIPAAQKDLIAEYKKKIEEEKNPKIEGEEGFDEEAHYDIERRKNLNEKQGLLEELMKRQNDADREKNVSAELLDLETNQRKTLTQEKMSIDNEIEKIELNMKMTLMDIKDFKYEYEEKDGVRIPKNGAEYKELNDKYTIMQDKLNDLKNAKNLCETKLEEFRQKDNEKTEKVSKAWYDVKNDKDTTKQPEEKQTEAKQLGEKQPEEKQTEAKQLGEKQPETEQIENNELNVFEKNNVINSVAQEMKEEDKNYSKIHLQGNNLKETPKITDSIKYIEIVEKNEKIYYKDNFGKEKETSTNFDKKELYKDLKIADICKELTNSKISSMFLRRKINPNIVSVLRYHPDQLKEYIASLKDKKELPFELVHDMEGISLWKKFRLGKFTKLEEKLGAKVLGKMFDKNKTLTEPNVIDKNKEANEVKTKIEKAKMETLENDKYRSVIPKDVKKTSKVNLDTKYKVDNDGNIIEKVAKAKYEKVNEEEQAKRAEEVKKIMEEKGADR